MQSQITARIKKLRRNKGLTQPEMAEKLNIAQSAYARLEQGETSTWAKYFEDLLQIFEITPEKFFEGIETKVVINNHNDCTYSGNSNIDCTYSENPNVEHPANQELYEKLMEQYEERQKDKDQQIASLKDEIGFLRRMLEDKQV